MQQQAVIQSNGRVQHGDDSGLFVTFSMEAMHDEEASTQEGRPIYRNVEFVTIVIIGDNKNIVKRPVRFHQEGVYPPDPERWPSKYQQFKNQQVQIEDGTPITEWPPLNPAQAMTLKSLGVHTVENLSTISDNNLANIGPGARELREKAKMFLEEARDGSALIRVTAERDDLLKQVQALKAQLQGVISETNADPILPKVTLTPSTEPIDFTPATSSYGRRGRPPKQPEEKQSA